MAERVRKCCCYSCIHLQKENPIISGEMALYRCTSQKRNGRCAGWVSQENTEAGLAQLGCSYGNKLYSGDIIEVESIFSDSKQRYLYCGKLRGYRLIVDMPEFVPHVVPNSWFRSTTGRLRRQNHIIIQKKEQSTYYKKLARSIKEEYSHE